MTIANGGSTAVNGWSLVFTLPGAQKITNVWSASATQSGKQVTATNAACNATIPAGGSVNFGFSAGSTPGTNGVPASFTLNGKACTVS